MNRSQRRAVLHDVRKLGCKCAPDITDAPRGGWPAGSISGAHISHEPGCPLGDSVLAFNSAGIIPAILVNAPSRCAR